MPKLDHLVYGSPSFTFEAMLPSFPIAPTNLGFTSLNEPWGRDEPVTAISDAVAQSISLFPFSVILTYLHSSPVGRSYLSEAEAILNISPALSYSAAYR
jgi:hypothetical protein